MEPQQVIQGKDGFILANVLTVIVSLMLELMRWIVSWTESTVGSGFSAKSPNT